MVEGQGCFFMFTFQTLFLSGKSLKTYCGIIVLLLLSSSWVSATHFLKVLVMDIFNVPINHAVILLSGDIPELYQCQQCRDKSKVLYANRFMALELFPSVLPKFELQQYIHRRWGRYYLLDKYLFNSD